MRKNQGFTHDQLVKIFLRRRRQLIRSIGDLIFERKGVSRTCACFSVYRDIMGYSEFEKVMAIGLMKAWRNLRRVSRELNIHFKTNQKWWSRKNEGQGP